MSVLSSVKLALGKLPVGVRNGWESAVALALAEALDDEPNASMARELRALMKELAAGTAGGEAKGDLSDDLAARRADRIAKAKSS